MLSEKFDFLSSNQQKIVIASNTMDGTVLITGPTGSGKSYLARLIHESHVKRKTKKFFVINLATLSTNLLEAELFGYERGAFTGAAQRRMGRLEYCEGGTVFLDEIGELPLHLQGKLLDFLQYKRVTPLGSNHETILNVRIIAATNRNLKEDIDRGIFREDLFHRLRVFHLELESVSKKRNLILPLAKKILFQKSREAGRDNISFSERTEEIFESYSWPGNFRELENAIFYSLGMEQGNLIQPSSLPKELQRHYENMAIFDGDESLCVESTSITPSLPLSLLKIQFALHYPSVKDEFEKKFLERAFHLCGKKVLPTSRAIQMNKVSLLTKLRKYKIIEKRSAPIADPSQ